MLIIILWFRTKWPLQRFRLTYHNHDVKSGTPATSLPTTSDTMMLIKTNIRRGERWLIIDWSDFLSIVGVSTEGLFKIGVRIFNMHLTLFALLSSQNDKVVYFFIRL
jgi:hypothetical protein